MKKNLFCKAMTAAAMMLLGLSFTGCGENDNAIIDGKVWVKPEVTLTDGGATITASSPADISRMIGRIRSEILDAAQKGETFTLDIETPILNSSGSDNTISIPTLTGSDMVVNFKGNMSTETPLQIESKGVADNADATTATNKMEINIPSASDVDLQINMPTTTVTLNAASGSVNIDELVAKTAINTLIISKGVTVNWLKMNGGRAVVEDGAKVLGYIRNGDEKEGNERDAEANEDGIRPINGEIGIDDNGNPWWGDDVVYIDGEDEKPYCVQNLKIVKGEAAMVRVDIHNAKAKDALESIIIADGAAVGFDSWGESDENSIYIEAKGVKLVKGLGNKTAKIYSRYCSIDNTLEDGTKEYFSYINLRFAKELSNVIVDDTINPESYVWDESKGEYVALGKIETTYGYIDLGPNSTDCDFIAPQEIYGTVINNEMSKVTNCNLVTTLKKENYSTYIRSINAINSKLTASNISGISPTSENSTFKGRSISFTNYYVSGNSATVKNCKFEALDKENQAQVFFPYQTKDRSSFNFGFDTCDFGKGFKFYTDYEGQEPWLDKDGKPVTKCYSWYELDDEGYVKDWNRHQSTNLDDVPAKNKENYEAGQTWWGSNGYWIEEDPAGLMKKTFYKDYKGYLTLTNTTLDGKAITSKTDMISGVGYGRDEKGEQATRTYYVIDGTTYEALYSSNDKKWILVAVE